MQHVGDKKSNKEAEPETLNPKPLHALDTIPLPGEGGVRSWSSIASQAKKKKRKVGEKIVEEEDVVDKALKNKKNRRLEKRKGARRAEKSMWEM